MPQNPTNQPTNQPGVSDRIMTPSQHLDNNFSVSLLSGYALNMSLPKQEKDKFYEVLCTVISIKQ